MAEPGITRRDALIAAGTVGAVGAGALGFAGVIGLVSGEDDPATTLVAPRTSDLPAADPTASGWQQAPELVVPLLAQQLVPPSLPTIGVADLRVRALHDGRRLAFRLEWEDATVEDLDGIGAYHDAAAVMLPTTPGAERPPVTMGEAGAPVDILQWRATWQRDVASQGKTGVDQIYPRVVHDVMPDDVLPPETAALYWVGRAAGNPLSLKTRTTSVERVVAEGYGTSTHVADAKPEGTGVHDGSSWHVTVTYPGADLAASTPTTAAFAVWLGSQDNRGGRKHYADWVPLRLDGL
jgi:hypothetical protein